MNVQEYLKYSGMTLTALAAKCGLSYSQVHWITRGRKPSLKSAIALEEFSQGRIKIRDIIPQKELKKWIDAIEKR